MLLTAVLAVEGRILGPPGGARPAAVLSCTRCRTPRAAQVYCLPDNYEVLDKSLDDIRHVRDPRFRKEEIASLDKWVEMR